MEQRRLRLGDILDDYCPRERRVTNHAVVAMIEEDVRQTRCTTCDAEHVYKGGKAPRRKKSESTGTLYKEVLAGISDQDTVPVRAGNTMASADSANPAHSDARDDFEIPDDSASGDDALAAQAADEPEDIEPEGAPRVDEGPVHRPLIRAQLARPEGVKVERQAPDFTIRQNPNGRGGSFRGTGDVRTRGGSGSGSGGGAGRGSNGSNNGHRFGRGPMRSGSGGGTGSGRGANQGFGRGPGNAGPRKRSR
jgi:hypothetical protein